MRRLVFALMVLLPTVCSAQDSVKEIPAFYLRPNLINLIDDAPGIIDNGYLLIDNYKTADQFFDHIPPDVDLDSERLIIFSWKGSVTDKIIYDKAGNTYNFVYIKGKMINPKQHIKIVSVPKKNDWLYHRVLE